MLFQDQDSSRFAVLHQSVAMLFNALHVLVQKTFVLILPQIRFRQCKEEYDRAI